MPHTTATTGQQAILTPHSAVICFRLQGVDLHLVGLTEHLSLDTFNTLLLLQPLACKMQRSHVEMADQAPTLWRCWHPLLLRSLLLVPVRL
jgi:hypothetical protein